MLRFISRCCTIFRSQGKPWGNGPQYMENMNQTSVGAKNKKPRTYVSSPLLQSRGSMSGQGPEWHVAMAPQDTMSRIQRAVLAFRKQSVGTEVPSPFIYQGLPQNGATPTTVDILFCFPLNPPPTKTPLALNLGNAFHHGCWTRRTRCPSK